MSNLVNAERVTMSYGTRTLLDGISLGLGRGEAVGVVGRNGAGKTTLLRVLAGMLAPDEGRVTHSGQLSIGFLHQADDIAADASVRDLIVGGAPDHVWARQSSDASDRRTPACRCRPRCPSRQLERRASVAESRW